MKTIHYAIASNTYHLKKTIILSIIFLLFLSLLTGTLNLIDIEKILYNQYIDFTNTTPTALFQKRLQNYYFLILFLYVIAISIYSYFFLKTKQEDLIKWKLMGLSNFFIIKQILVEFFIPTFFVTFSVLLFLLIFQNTYDSVLFTCYHEISKPLNFFKSFNTPLTKSTMMVKEMTPLTNTMDHIQYLDLGINCLPSKYVWSALVKTYTTLLVLLSIITSIETNLFIKKSKNQLRK